MNSQFQKDFEEKFPAIREKCGAFLYTLYPRMQCIGVRGSQPMWILVGRALFDEAGWISKNIDGEKVAVSIGIEVKETKQRHPSMKIIGKDGTGSGIQAHQLEALAAVHRDGGIAALLWSNGGITGVLDGEYISKCFYDYGVSLEVERMGKTPAYGSRTVPWSLFREVDIDEDPTAVIILPVKEPTLKQALAAKRKRARKMIEKAQAEQADQDDNAGFIVEAAGGAEDDDEE